LLGSLPALVKMLVLYLIIMCFSFFALGVGSVTLVFGVGHSLFFAVDVHTIVFVTTLIVISSSVIIWSYYYLDSELSFRKFCSLVFCFLLSMFGLVCCGNLLSSLIFWDLLGFSSFFLVIFPRSRAALSGGLLTGLTNRLGDVFLLFLFALRFTTTSNSTSIAKFLIAAAAITKSAQAPFSAWLPAAMVAPTPVSALVHSSTLVTAGVYLIFRFTPALSCTLLYIGLFTSFLAGWAASAEWLVKRVVALSTLRQLGFMLSCLGLGQRSIAFAHLNTHAAFKALLFLAVGVMTHCNYGSQQLRLSTNAFSSSCLVGFSVMISTLSMCGLFFLSGWATKDTILTAFTNNFISGCVVFILWVSTALTVLYSFRLLATSISGINNFLAFTRTGTLPVFATLPLTILCVLSIIEGYITVLGKSMYVPVLVSLFSTNTILNLYAGCTAAWLFYRFLRPYLSPWIPLMHSTSLVSSARVPLSSTILTENRILSGLGASQLASAALLGSHGLQAFRVYFVVLGVLFVLF